jgi:hypothetical protein
MQHAQLIRASDPERLYEGLGWSLQDSSVCDRRLAEFIFRNLRGSAYASLGYGSVDDVLNGDIRSVRRMNATTGSDIHLCGVTERDELRAFGLWYSLEGGDLDLLPPDCRESGGRLADWERCEIAYGDWIIIDATSRVRGLGRALFAVMLNDMAEAGYRGWYGRTVVPENRAIYDRLYLRHGRAELVGEWKDGPLTRIGFLGNLRGEWTRSLLEDSLLGCPLSGAFPRCS